MQSIVHHKSICILVMLAVSLNLLSMKSKNRMEISSSYTAVLGMMNEEVDWYFKQIEDLRKEFKKELGIGYCQYFMFRQNTIQ